MFSWARETEEQVNKWDYIKLKSFGTVKKIIDKTECKKIFGDGIFHEELISKICKELIQLNSNNNNNHYYYSIIQCPN